MTSLGSLLVVTAAVAFFFTLSTGEAVLPEDDVDTQFEVELKSFSNCDNYPSAPMMFKELQVNQVAKKKFAVNGGVDMNMTVTNDIMATVTIMQCEDTTSDDTCEFIAAVRGSNFCDKITKEDTPWYNFIKETDIGNKCPVNPGTYTLKGAPMDLKDAEGVPLTPGHWKIRMELYSKAFEGDAESLGMEPFGCNVVEISVSAARGALRK